MIIRKPYAFLVKRFRLIHAILFGLLFYIIVKTFNIFSFFNNYATNKYFDSVSIDNLSIFTFLGCVFIVLVSVLIYYLLSVKNKPKKLYMFLCGYYIIVFIFFLVILILMNELEYRIFDNEIVRIIRDVCILVIVPQVIFNVVIFGRALGFNLKEFDFKKDLEEIVLEESDSEEVEVVLGNDGYKYKRQFRKALRYLKYFALENKFLVIIISSILSLVLSLTLIVNLKVYNKHYDENQEFVANSVWYTVSESYITNKDVYGNIINKDKYYLLVRVNLKNKLNRTIKVDRNTFRLKVGSDRIAPKFSMSDLFVDMGETFKEIILTSGMEKNVVLVFEIDKEDYKSEYLIRVKNVDEINLGDLKSEFADISTRPESLMDEELVGNYSIPGVVEFKDSFINGVSLDFVSYEINSSFKEIYENCYEGICSDYTYIVKPSGRSNAVMRIKGNLENKSDYDYIKYPKDLFQYFATIRYRYEGKIRELRTNIINSNYMINEYTYIEVPERIVEANKIEILINIRGIKYNLILK